MLKSYWQKLLKNHRMKDLENLSIQANGKKTFQKELRKAIRKVKFSLNRNEKKGLIKKIKDSEYCNF